MTRSEFLYNGNCLLANNDPLLKNGNFFVTNQRLVMVKSDFPCNGNHFTANQRPSWKVECSHWNGDHYVCEPVPHPEKKEYTVV